MHESALRSLAESALTHLTRTLTARRVDFEIKHTNNQGQIFWLSRGFWEPAHIQERSMCSGLIRYEAYLSRRESQRLGWPTRKKHLLLVFVCISGEYEDLHHVEAAREWNQLHCVILSAYKNHSKKDENHNLLSFILYANRFHSAATRSKNPPLCISLCILTSAKQSEVAIHFSALCFAHVLHSRVVRKCYPLLCFLSVLLTLWQSRWKLWSTTLLRAFTSYCQCHTEEFTKLHTSMSSCHNFGNPCLHFRAMDSCFCLWIQISNLVWCLLGMKLGNFFDLFEALQSVQTVDV